MRIIRFSSARLLFLVLSFVLIGGGLVYTFVVQGGFNLSIDFLAGLQQQVEIRTPGESPDTDEVRAVLDELVSVQVQSIGPQSEGRFNVRVRDPDGRSNFSIVTSRRVLELLRDRYGETSVVELENVYVGPRFSGSLTGQVILLTSLALALILAYVWFRFSLRFALAAIVALLHDTLAILSFIGVVQLEVTTATIAAVLTIIGYSLNDTIVIFDRVRENEKILHDSPYREIVDNSITRSLSRTLITSLTTLLAVAAIYVFAAGTVQDFALSLMIGVVVGTYSSIFIASPLLIAWQRLRIRDRERRREMPVTDESTERVPALAAADSAPSSSKSGVDVAAIKRELIRSRPTRTASKSRKKRRK